MSQEDEFYQMNEASINLDSIYKTIMDCYTLYITNSIFNFEGKVLINEKEYKYSLYAQDPYFYLSIDNNSEKIIKLPPLQIIFDKIKSKKIIYTIEQLKACLKNLKYIEPKIKLPDMQKNIEDFYDLDYEIIEAEIIDEGDDKPLFKSIIKFEKQIKYDRVIDLKFEELPIHFKDYLKQKNNDISFPFYISPYRAKFFKQIFSCLKNNKHIFITGLHGIGKSISLFMLKFLYTQYKFIYLNLDMIKYKKYNIWRNMIAYEFGSIFENYNDFHKIMNDESIKNSKEYLTIVYSILSKIINTKFKNKIFLIIDQYKIEKDKNNSLENIKKIINSNDEIKLIICSSVNDKKLREEVIQKIILGNDSTFLYIVNNLSMNSNKNKLDNAIFLLFDSLSYYINMFESNNKKDNDKTKDLIIKIIIKKIKNYYSNKSINCLEGINSMEEYVNKALSYEEFIKVEKYFSLKYFKLYKINKHNKEEINISFTQPVIKDEDTEKFIFIYSFPFLEKVIKVYKENEYENIINNGFYNNQKEGTQGDLFEFIVLDKLKSFKRLEMFTGIFSRITKIIEIYSIFDILNKKQKNSIYLNSIKEFEETNEDDVILFLFKFSRTPRYDAMIYCRKNNIGILLQITIHKSKRDLECYLNNVIISNDSIKIKDEFYNVFQEQIKNLCLYFIINPSKTSIEELKNNYFNNSLNFFLYDIKEKYFGILNHDYKIEKINKIEFKNENYFSDIEITETDKIINDMINENENEIDVSQIIINNLLNKKRKNEYIDNSKSYEYFNNYTNDLYSNKEFNDFIYKIINKKNYYFLFISSLEKYIPFSQLLNNKIIRIINEEKKINLVFYQTKEKILIFNLITNNIEKSSDFIKIYNEEDFKIIFVKIKIRN